MSKQKSINAVNKKFSISLLKLNQQGQNNQKDESYEFDAPKYFDLSTLPESPVGNDLNIDPWFFKIHSDKMKQINQSKHPRKKKYSQYQKDNDEDKNSRNSEFKIEKRNKLPIGNSRKTTISVLKTLDTLNLSKERSSNFKRSLCIKKTFDNIKKLKRGVSADTYSYYNHKLNKEDKDKEKENIEGSNRKAISKIKITYCPRVHDGKWEDMKGLKWYNLSPESRSKANDEISMMIKANAFENKNQNEKI